MKNAAKLCGILLVLTGDLMIQIHVATGSSYQELDEPCQWLNTCSSQGMLSLDVDNNITFEGANTTITVSLNETAHMGEDIYYQICYTNNELLGVPIFQNSTNETAVATQHEWDEPGQYTLFARATSVSFCDCVNITMVVAEKGGLELTVTVTDELDESSNVPQQDLEMQYCDRTSLVVGNITFHSSTNLSRLHGHHFYYTYTFGDSEMELSSRNNSTVTYFYNESGYFEYVVQVIGVMNDSLSKDTKAFYTVHNGNVTLLDAVANIDVFVNNNHSVKVSTETDVKFSSDGSRPIFVEWNITRTNDSKHFGNDSTMLSVNSTKNYKYQNVMFPNVVGDFQFEVLFYNDANCVNGTAQFSVVQGSSPAVVASSTAVTVLAVLITITILLILLIAGGCIPYRRYKSRLTETANFRFVDLSDSGTYLKRLKVKTSQIRDKVPFIKQQHTERVGLVLPSREQELQDPVYGINTTVLPFAPHNDL